MLPRFSTLCVYILGARPTVPLDIFHIDYIHRFNLIIALNSQFFLGGKNKKDYTRC